MYIIYNYYNYKHRRILQRYIILIYDAISSNVSANLRSRSACIYILYTIIAIQVYTATTIILDTYMMRERCCA